MFSSIGFRFSETIASRLRVWGKPLSSGRLFFRPLSLFNTSQESKSHRDIMPISRDSELITALQTLSIKSPKLVHASTYAVPDDPDTEIQSWKMNEFKYYDVPSPFPTLARGLFSTKVKEKDSTAHRIVARGYDKFFNIGEIPWTTWAWLEEHTIAPYTLSLKSNGCIILIAALTPSKLLVTSKHSLGPVQGVPLSHAQAGEMWLNKYLKKLGKLEDHLAAELWENNWTAVAELCDDSFEEHVLGYPEDKTGLHLHGLNVRSEAFETMPTEVVDAFADKWGFIKTATTVIDSIKDVKDFTNACATNGQWNGEPIEGFVVRTHVTGGRKNGSPYGDGSSFFFKVKFDEPYMMYRDWREVTKMLLSAKGAMNVRKLPKSRMKRPETKLYASWVVEEFKRDPDTFQDYTKGKGIIATRERFLAWLKSDSGLAAVEKGDELVPTSSDFGKTIIVPVAIPGCGKTSVAIALSNIFGFGHTQSDDVQAKKAAPVFIKRVVKLLANHNVVIADKNNHLRQHRQQLRDAVGLMQPPVRLLALNWLMDQPPAMIHRVCRDRVVNRGDSHQTLRADTSGAKSHEEVLWKFINSTEELAPAEVDAVIDMKIGEGLEEAIKRAVDGVVQVLGLPPPDEEKFAEGLNAIEHYKPEYRKADEKSKKGDLARYFALLPELDLSDYLDRIFTNVDVNEELKNAWNLLKLGNRVTERPHVTIVHKNDIDANRGLWDRCAALHAIPVNPPMFKATLGNVMWNGRVMAMTVKALALEDAGSVEGQGKEFLSNLAAEVADKLHITVGTAEVGILPLEAREMVLDWDRGSKEGVTAQSLDDTIIRGQIKGLIS